MEFLLASLLRLDMSTLDRLTWCGIAVTLLIGGCASGTNSTKSSGVARCAESAVTAYNTGDFRCAEQMLPALKNPATRAELRAYMALRAGRLQEGLSALDRAIKIIEHHGSKYSDSHSRQLNHLRRLRQLFGTARRHVSDSADTTTADGGSPGVPEE